MEPQRVTNQKRAILVVGSLVAVVALVLGIVLATQDDDEPTSTASSSSTTSTVASSTSTTVAASTTTTTVDPGDLDLAAFPDLRSGDRFDDPHALVRAFATEVLGFDTDLVVGAMQQGDNRSGEIEVSPSVGTRKTTVAVRQLASGAWVVVAASATTIELETPIPRTRIASPQPLIGAATAFEGAVLVQLYADGSNAPIGATNVLGRGDGVMGDFTGSLTFTVPEGATHGLLVLSEASAEDGTTVAATAVRVRF